MGYLQRGSGPRRPQLPREPGEAARGPPRREQLQRVVAAADEVAPAEHEGGGGVRLVALVVERGLVGLEPGLVEVAVGEGEVLQLREFACTR